jgi:glycosyltransferase involved in cell wall biosynthesis
MRRIGIDARELCGRATGVGRYLGGLLQQWNADAPHQFVLYAHEALTWPLDASRFTTRVIPGAGGSWWEQIDLPRAAAGDHLDVWFSPAYTAPLRLDVPIVVAIHDLSFVAHPEWFRFREGIRRRWLTGRAAAHARAIVTISEFSKRELMERLDVAANKIHVIAPGIEIPGQRPETGPASDLHARTARLHRILFVGSVFNRRHVPDLIRAFAPIARAHPAAGLDIVGDDRSYPREDLQGFIDAEGLQAQVAWHRYVTEDQLRHLYARAGAFAFLSEYEGLGLTPLEAMANGVPPVLLDTSVARESCGDAALYVALGDRRGATRALELALFDEPMRARLLAAAPHELTKYQWPDAARKTLAVLLS